MPMDLRPAVELIIFGIKELLAGSDLQRRKANHARVEGAYHVPSRPFYVGDDTSPRRHR